MKNWNDHLATVMGLLVAIAMDWMMIDWENFTWTSNNIMKLALSAIVAAGGFVSRIKTKSNGTNHTAQSETDLLNKTV